MVQYLAWPLPTIFQAFRDWRKETGAASGKSPGCSQETLDHSTSGKQTWNMSWNPSVRRRLFRSTRQPRPSPFPGTPHLQPRSCSSRARPRSSVSLRTEKPSGRHSQPVSLWTPTCSSPPACLVPVRPRARDGRAGRFARLPLGLSAF